MDSLVKATKPDVPVPGFGRYGKAGKTETINTVIADEDAKSKQKVQRVTRAKERYQVKNHFEPSKAKKGKKGNVKKGRG